MNIYGNRTVKFLIWRLILRNPRFRRVLQKMLFGSGEREISLIGQPLTIDAQEEIGYRRAADAQTHNIVFRDEIPQMMSVMSFLEAGATFVDIGANVGLWTINAASILQLMGRGRVISVEANPDTFARLSRNVARFSNVDAFNVALSDQAGELTFYGGAASGVFSVQRGPFNTGETRVIASVTFDSLEQPLGRVIVKIDVEGHELAVLRGMRKLLASDGLRAIFIDQFDVSTAAEITELLKDYTFFDGRTRQPIEEVTRSIPLLAVRKN